MLVKNWFDFQKLREISLLHSHFNFDSEHDCCDAITMNLTDENSKFQTLSLIITTTQWARNVKVRHC